MLGQGPCFIKFIPVPSEQVTCTTLISPYWFWKMNFRKQRQTLQYYNPTSPSMAHAVKSSLIGASRLRMIVKEEIWCQESKFYSSGICACIFLIARLFDKKREIIELFLFVRNSTPSKALCDLLVTQ